jgi:alcohol dehydrogenase class IV
MRLEFATAHRILFGVGMLREGVDAMAAMGRRALVVTGRQPARAQPLLEMLGQPGTMTAWTFSIPGEPNVSQVEEGAALARKEDLELVIGFGGGSPIDAAKAIAAMATNQGAVLDYLEVVGRGQILSRAPLPCVAIPTTAGTGAEVTRNAVLASPAHRVKASLRSPLLLPRLAVVDPDLTQQLPADLTASTGLDALTQLIEPFVSVRANPLTDGFCREGLVRVARSLRRAWASPNDTAARSDMAFGSLLSGLALANAGLGVVHGFAAPIGGMFPAPHGAVCAALLSPAIEVNVRVCRERHGDGPAAARFDEVGRMLTGRPDAGARDAVTWVQEICAELRMPALREYGIQPAHVPEICAKAAQSSSMKGNPIPLTAVELEEILRRAL